MYDSSCSGSVTQPCCRLAPDLLILGRWATDWSTSFNASKSSHMLVRRQHGVSSSPELVLDSTAIPAVPCTVHLGVHLSSSLSWFAHVAALLLRVCFKVYVLKRLAHRLGSAYVVKRLYLSLVRPSLEYASPVWDACSRADSLSLERVQLSIARAVLRGGRRDLSNVSVLSLIGWPTLVLETPALQTSSVLASFAWWGTPIPPSSGAPDDVGSCAICLA